MQIEQITLRNFRCFEERTFNLDPHFNVLYGENGTGKTAILEAMAVAIGSWLLGVSEFGRGIRWEDVRLLASKQGEEIVFEPQAPAEITARGSVVGERLEWKRTRANPRGGTTYALAKEIRTLSQKTIKQIREGGDVVAPVIAYYDTARLWSPHYDTAARKASIKKSELSRLEAYRDCLNGKLDILGLMRWLDRQDRIEYEEKSRPKLYSAVLSAMTEILGDVEEIKYSSRRAEIVVTFKGREPQPFTNLSDGQRSMLALAGDIATRMARLNPQLGENALGETPGVVLIDELDLHLHPNWQRGIVPSLQKTFPKVQFITTTHSVFIMQTLEESNLLPIEGQPVSSLGNLGIETIAKGLMNVERPEVSPKYHEQVEVAKDYLETLEEAKDAPEEKLAQYMERLSEGIGPYAHNPAFQAILEMERLAKLGR